MTSSAPKLQQLLLCCIAPVACSIMIGFIFFQGRVFHLHSHAMVFIVASVIASVFYHLLVLASQRDAYFGLVLLFVLNLIVDRSTRPALIVRDILAVAGIALSMLLFRYLRDSMRFRYFYAPIVLAGIYGVVNLVTSELNLVIQGTSSTLSLSEHYLSVAARSVHFGALIGFAIGCGLAFNEKFGLVMTST